MAVFSAPGVGADRYAARGYCRLPLLSAAAVLSLAVAAIPCIAGESISECGPIKLDQCNWSPATTRDAIAQSSTNFSVRSFLDGPRAADVARHSEQLCRRLRRDLFGLEPSARWQPKCQIVLHATRASYSAAVGQGGVQTIGSSTITLSGGRVTKRRVDLLALDIEKGLAALPHELVHVLFVDAFPNTPPPKWAEEGLALSLDPAEKLTLHERDLNVALATNTALPLSRLLADTNYPHPSHRATFYAQSVSLVDYLTRQASPGTFVRFVKISAARGTTRALADVYQLEPAQLEREWRAHVTSMELAVNR